MSASRRIRSWHRSLWVLILAVVLWPAVLATASPLEPRTLLEIEGSLSGDLFGTAVASAGDVNGDGYGDVIVGAPATRRAYVYYGGREMDAVPDLILGAGPNLNPPAGFGSAVAGADDFNGDGFDDIVVGAPGASRLTENAGRVYVYYGGPTGGALAGAGPDLVLIGSPPYNYEFGMSVAIGDVSGDGWADVIVAGTVRAHVFFGGPGADAAADLVLFPLQNTFPPYIFPVMCASPAGDMNGDGFTDIVVGIPTVGAMFPQGYGYLYYGGPAADATSDRALRGQDSPFLDSFAAAVAPAGDMNGDGQGDLIVGSPGYQAFAGRAYVFVSGSSVGRPIDALGGGGGFGSAVAGLGDVDGDGRDDAIVGSPSSSGGGRAYVYLGKPGQYAGPDVELGVASGDKFGASVAGAGDVDGDGFPDIVVGAPGGSSGRAYVFSLHEALLAADIDLDPSTINLESRGPWVTAYIEPDGFDPASIDVSSVLLAGSVAAETKFAVVGDHDGDELADVMLKFSRSALDPLLSPGINTLEVTGSLVTGESFAGTDDVRVIAPPRPLPTASIMPNPLNPTGVLTLRIARPGPVTVRMFDHRGRLVRTILEGRFLSSGEHKVGIDGRGERGVPLASGVYFYRAETSEGIVTGRLAIMK